MTTPVQRPASNSESRKRLAEHQPVVHTFGYGGSRLHCRCGDESVECGETYVEHLHAGLPGYFIALDCHDNPAVWLENGDWPVEVVGIDGWRVKRDYPELWAVIVAAVEGGAR